MQMQTKASLHAMHIASLQDIPEEQLLLQVQNQCVVLAQSMSKTSQPAAWVMTPKYINHAIATSVATVQVASRRAVTAPPTENAKHQTHRDIATTGT